MAFSSTVWPGMVNSGGTNTLLTTGNGGTHEPAAAPGEVEDGGIVSARTSLDGGTAEAPTMPPLAIPDPLASESIDHEAAAAAPNTTTYVSSVTTAEGTRDFFRISQTEYPPVAN